MNYAITISIAALFLFGLGCTSGSPTNGNQSQMEVEIPDEVLLKFHTGVIFHPLLCYDLPTGVVSDSLRTILLEQRFSFGSGIVRLQDLRAALVGYGGRHLRRTVVDDPCRDTLIAGIGGGLVPNDNFDRMVLVLNNDTSAATVAATLRRDYPSAIDSARVNTEKK